VYRKDGRVDTDAGRLGMVELAQIGVRSGNGMGEVIRPAKRKFVIGLTGNIACGKSAVAAELGRLGAEVIDADQVAHEVMSPHTPAWEKIVAVFGKEILKPDGSIDRRRLGEIVFADPKKLERLEALVHPATLAEVKRRVEASTSSVVVVEAIKLIERGMHRDCNSVWVVTCRPEQQLERLMERSGFSEEEARRRIKAQRPADEKLRHADVVIDNSGDREQLRRQVEKAWRALGLPLCPREGGDAG